MNRLLLASIPASAIVLAVTLHAEETTTFRSVEALRKLGVNKCLPAVGRMTKFFFDADNFGFVNFWNQAKADDRMTVTFLTKTFEDGVAQVTLAVSPTTEGTCDVHFTHTIVVKGTCGKLRDTTFKDWKFYYELGATTLYEDPTTPTVNASLTPIVGGGACLVEKAGLLTFAQEKPK